MAKDKAARIEMVDPETGDILTWETEEELEQFYNTLKDLINKASWKQAAEFIANIRKTAGPLMDAYKELEELRPYIDAELKKPEYNGATLMDLLSDVETKDLSELPPDSLLYKVLEAARKAKDTATKYNKLQSLQINIDKGQLAFFDINAPKMQDINGQRTFVPPPAVKNEKGFYRVGFEKQNSPEEITLFYNFDFDESLLNKMGLTKQIDYEDFFILQCMFNNMLQGNTRFTPTKIFRDLNGTEPKPEQRKNIIDRAYKMLAVTLRIDERDILKAWNVKTDKETYKTLTGRLAPINIIEEKTIVSGGTADCIIEMLEPPIMFRTGRTIGQFTTIPAGLIAVKKENGSNLKHTPRYWKMLFYLIRRISRIKNGTMKNKLLYSSFVSDMGSKTTRQKQLIMEMLFTMLDHFKREGFINGYKEEVTKTTGQAGLRFIFDTDTNNKLKAKRKKELRGPKKTK